MKKRINIRPATKSERGGSSPYWQWVTNHSVPNEHGEYPEYAEANPDVLNDENLLWKLSETEEEDTTKRKKFRSALRRALNKLTNTDREIVIVMSQGCLNISKIAEKIGMSRGFVRHRIQKIQELSAKMLELGSIDERVTE